MTAVILPVDETASASVTSSLLSTYKRAPMEFVRGEGVEVRGVLVQRGDRRSWRHLGLRVNLEPRPPTLHIGLPVAADDRA